MNIATSFREKVDQQIMERRRFLLHRTYSANSANNYRVYPEGYDPSLSPMAEVKKGASPRQFNCDAQRCKIAETASQGGQHAFAHNRSLSSLLLASAFTFAAAPAPAVDVTPERLVNADREPGNWLMITALTTRSAIRRSARSIAATSKTSSSPMRSRWAAPQ